MKTIFPRLLGALALVCGLWAAPLAASAQTAQPITTCGSGPTYQANGLPMPLTQDTTGKLCTSGAGGSGGAVTNAGTFAVQDNGTSIGTVATNTTSANTKLDTIIANTAAAPVPNAVTSTNGSTTIATGNTFQTLLAANAARKGCLIQNPADATETLYVSVGIATGSATKAKSYQLAAGAAFSCNSGFNVVTDNIAVTAVTSTHAFVETDQ